MSENVIPISKTPSQEKVAFMPGKLDWNENGNFHENFLQKVKVKNSNLI